MLKGGYQILDLKDKALVTTSGGQTIAGLYATIENCNRKPILLTNIKISTTEYINAFIQVYLNANDKFEFTLYGYTWTIDEDDKLVLTAIE